MQFHHSLPANLSHDVLIPLPVNFACQLRIPFSLSADVSPYFPAFSAFSANRNCLQSCGSCTHLPLSLTSRTRPAFCPLRHSMLRRLNLSLLSSTITSMEIDPILFDHPFSRLMFFCASPFVCPSASPLFAPCLSLHLHFISRTKKKFAKMHARERIKSCR